MRQVSRQLSIGNMYDAQDYGETFDRVVTMAPEEYDVSTHTHLIRDGDHSYETFETAVWDVIKGIQNGERVLVHCQAGQSRSVSVASAAYAYPSDYTLDDSFYICEQTGVRPHPDLIESAERFINQNL